MILEQNRCDSIESTSFDDYVGKVCGAESLLLGKVESRRLKRIDIEWLHSIEHGGHQNFFFVLM